MKRTYTSRAGRPMVIVLDGGRAVPVANAKDIRAAQSAPRNEALAAAMRSAAQNKALKNR